MGKTGKNSLTVSLNMPPPVRRRFLWLEERVKSRLPEGYYKRQRLLEELLGLSPNPATTPEERLFFQAAGTLPPDDEIEIDEVDGLNDQFTEFAARIKSKSRAAAPAQKKAGAKR